MIHFITHPEVLIDPAVPVPDWPLSPLGRQRAAAMLRQPWVAGIGAVFTSAERKATDTAGVLADYLGLTPIVLPALGENDRSATGYLPRAEFEAVADQFFARPEASIRGWERAVDAQARIVRAWHQVLSPAPTGDVAIVSHGGVGALLLCHLRGVPIGRAADQPGDGGGNVFTVDAGVVIAGWRPIDGAFSG